MPPLTKLLSLTVLATLAACTSSQAEMSLPGLDYLNRVWVDAEGNTYSVIQQPGGQLTIHQPTTGDFFVYQRTNGSFTGRPTHAPPLVLQQEKLLLGEQQLLPADVIAQEISFSNRGIQFYGILTIPRSDRPVPLVVNSHGSERDAATTFDWAAAWYTEAGFATFIFDKRGTGRSGGKFTNDFDILASDLEAAIAAVSDNPLIDARLIGAGGYSQGVYVTTLAASRNSAIRFIIASFGVVQSPLMEDFQETQLHFLANYPEADWNRFRLLVEACGEAFALGNSSQWKLVRQYRKEWRGKIDPGTLAGTLTGDGCLPWPGFALRLVGRSQFPPGLDWSHNPIPLVEGLDIPIIWQYGEADEDAPAEESVMQIQNWIADGKPFIVHTYANAAHGIYLTATDADGNSYRYKDPTYIRQLIEWLKQRNVEHLVKY